jgi:hypothetical protein
MSHHAELQGPGGSRLSSEDKLWSDAYHIAIVGASNPKGVRNTMVAHLATFGSGHPAVRAIEGHHAFLTGTSLGPEPADLAAVEENARRLGLMS